MAKWNEISYMILDGLKLKSDDSSFNIDHIVFLMLQYRTTLLEQRYTDQKKDIPKSNYQTICIDLENDMDCTLGNDIKSVQKIPDFVNLKGNEHIIINSVGKKFKNLNYTYVSPERMGYVGNNKWLNNIIYFSIGHDNILYLKSNNVNSEYLKKITISALFDDPREALDLACDGEGNLCDFMETEFPIDSALVSPLIDMVSRHLNDPVYRPEDNTNDASDNLSDANYGYKDDRRRRRV